MAKGFGERASRIVGEPVANGTSATVTDNLVSLQALLQDARSAVTSIRHLTPVLEGSLSVLVADARWALYFALLILVTVSICVVHSLSSSVVNEVGTAVLVLIFCAIVSQIWDISRL